MRCLAVCHTELVVRLLEAVLAPQAELDVVVESRAIAKRVQGGALSVTVADPMRVDTYVKAGLSPTIPIIVEVETLAEVRQALMGKADVILLDNMTPAMVRQAVKLIGHRALVEVSGGITLQNVRTMAEAGADRISIGALTHSAPAANISLVLTPLKIRRKRRT